MAKEKKLSLEDLASDMKECGAVDTNGQGKTMAAATFSCLVARLKKGESVYIHGLGTFVVRQLPDRMVRNPKTNTKVPAAACNKLVFKASKGVV